MPSLRSTLLAVAVVASAIAQYSPGIDPSTVEESERIRWCNDQQITCPFICEQTEPRTTEKNECYQESLTFECVCGNGKEANLTEYSLTLPFYVCQEKGTRCVEDCGSNSNCASDCWEKNPCGATNPQRSNATTTSGLPDATGTQTDDRNTVFTGRPGQEGSGGDGGSGAGALNAAGAYGMAVVVGGLFAGFAML